MLSLLTALVDEWCARYDPSAIRRDLEKIQVLTAARDDLFGRSIIVPDTVCEFYRDVFLRDMWKRNT